jgi:hypothetical protein
MSPWRAVNCCAEKCRRRVHCVGSRRPAVSAKPNPGGRLSARVPRVLQPACGRTGPRWHGVLRTCGASANLRCPGRRPRGITCCEFASELSARTDAASMSTYARLDTRWRALVAALAACPAIAGAMPLCAGPARPHAGWQGRAVVHYALFGAERALRRARRCAVPGRIRGWRLEGCCRRPAGLRERFSAYRAPRTSHARAV